MEKKPTSATRTRDARGRLSRVMIYQRLQDSLDQLQRIGGLPSPVEAEDIWGDIWYAEAHNSTAIENSDTSHIALGSRSHYHSSPVVSSRSTVGQ